MRKLSENQQDEAHKDWLHIVQDTKSVLNSLRSRDINLLFATSVVEEGEIDIKRVFNQVKNSVNCVIALSPFLRRGHRCMFFRNCFGRASDN